MPFFIPLLGLIIGILIGESISIPSWGIIPILIACSINLYLIKKASTPLKALKYNKGHWVWIFLIFTGIGIFDIALQKPIQPSENKLRNFILVEGEVIDSKSFANSDRFVVRVTRTIDSLYKVKNINNFKIILSSDGLSAEPGDLITFPAKFTKIIDNPNLRPSGYAERMSKIGIYYQIKAKEGEIKIKGYNNSLSNSAVAWRNKLIAKIEKSTLSRPACNFIVALLFGDRSFLSEAVKDTFSNAGVAHVLALSGMHVAIIMGIFLILLLPLKLIGLHRSRYIIALIMVWAYAFFTGMAPSTVRACIMTSFVVIAMSIQRRNNAENSLLASAFIILLFTPQALFDIGMQLSFLCVGSILLFAGPMNPVNQHSHPLLHTSIAAILVSLVSTITTWVVVSFYFNKIPLLFLPVNLCMLPLLPAFIWIAVAYIILLLCGIDISALSVILNKGYDLFEWLANRLSAFGESTVSLNIQFPVLVLWLLGILIIAYAIKKNINKKKVVIIGGVCMMVIAVICIPILNKKDMDGIIFQQNYSEIALALYSGNIPLESKMPRNSVSRIYHKGCEILSLDCAINADSLTSRLTSSHRSRKRYLIIGSGFRETPLKDIPEIKNFDKIILHSSLRRKMENQIRKEASEIGLRTLHSLREDGPLEELLPDSLPIIK